MRAVNTRKRAFAAALLAAGTALTACGGATVENSVTETSIAPLTREVPTSTASSASERASERESEASQTRDAQRPEPAAPLPQDQPAREVSEVPQAGQLSGVDREYLKALTDAGVDVEGVEDQMIGTASVICRSEGAPLDGATVEAIAGQLIEQGRTDVPMEELVTLIDSSARKAYC